jgi:hypothetical protein
MKGSSVGVQYSTAPILADLARFLIRARPGGMWGLEQIIFLTRRITRVGIPA